MIRIGMFLGDRYEILEKIGSGGMADMFKGRDHKLNRLVAVKVLKDEFVEDKNFVRRFREEAQAAAGLAHPNIVNIYDVGDEQNIKYIVMELVEGITLKDYIERKGKLTVKEATSIAIQVSAGLGVAHNNQIVHRDIKPQNIMISKEGKVKVTDFGIAKSISSHTNTSDAMGSVHYTSPEQARGGYSDSKSDIYSLGIVLYEMVTGRVPFDGETTVVVAVKHLQEEMVSPRVYASDVPVSLEHIILKCTEKSPDRRYSCIAELVADLKQSLVTPDVNFVKAVVADGAKTVAITRDDISKIKRETGRINLTTPVYEPVEESDEDEDDPFADADDEDYDEYDDDENDSGIDPRLEKIMTWGGIAAAVIIVIIIVVILFKMFGGGKTSEKPEQDPLKEIEIVDVYEEDEEEKAESQVQVPDLLGKSYSEAKDLLNELGLGIAFGETIQSNDYEEGQILGQRAEAGSTVEPNSTITVDICGGSEQIDVPNVVGVSKADAQNTLTSAGFQVSVTEKFDDNVAEGKVISMSPSGGSKANKSAVITITVSKGPEVMKVAVPKLAGLTEEEAKAKLAEAKLSAGSASQAFHETIEAGKIISQGVAENTKVAEGTAISYVVSKGKEIKEVYIGNYSEMTEADAVAKAESRGLKTKVEYAYHETMASGLVIDTNPVNGSTIKTGETITFIVSKGVQPMKEIPNVIGQDEEAAKSTLSAAGFNNVSVATGYSTAAEKGNVISQTTGTVAEGSAVTITVSLGQDPATCTHADANSDGTCDICGATGLATNTSGNGASGGSTAQ